MAQRRSGEVYHRQSYYTVQSIYCRSSICPGRLSTAWLVSLVVFSCHMVSNWLHSRVHLLSLRRLTCPVQDHFILLTVYIIYMTFVLYLTQMLVLLSLYVMLSILLSILVCAAANLFCACLVSVHVSAPYVIAISTQEWYTCLFRLMARLLLKIFRCLAYAAQPVFPFLVYEETYTCLSRVGLRVVQ